MAAFTRQAELRCEHWLALRPNARARMWCCWDWLNSRWKLDSKQWEEMRKLSSSTSECVSDLGSSVSSKQNQIPVIVFLTSEFQIIFLASRLYEKALVWFAAYRKERHQCKVCTQQCVSQEQHFFDELRERISCDVTSKHWSVISDQLSVIRVIVS